ncbi:TPA: LOW QUALITY PROTEIN: hypothetical protein N0F65_000068 [Lagenidium giganteum]|uniref:Uncharacterized protein n=1 Tax=Lagenidium giganteum TaxID=4803 RepID=A0AAV2YNQ4_9STRA|nr:TPA: LOW QUALITY PROTEIN: hypothetical protein N0F65_000068 [Lagenidium giganteum]
MALDQPTYFKTVINQYAANGNTTVDYNHYIQHYVGDFVLAESVRETYGGPIFVALLCDGNTACKCAVG